MILQQYSPKLEAWLKKNKPEIVELDAFDVAKLNKQEGKLEFIRFWTQRELEIPDGRSSYVSNFFIDWFPNIENITATYIPFVNARGGDVEDARREVLSKMSGMIGVLNIQSVGKQLPYKVVVHPHKTTQSGQFLLFLPELKTEVRDKRKELKQLETLYQKNL